MSGWLIFEIISVIFALEILSNAFDTMNRILLMALAFTLLSLGCKKEEDVVKPDRGRSYVHLLGAVNTDTFDVGIDYYNSRDLVIEDFYYHRNFPMVGYADMEAAGIPDSFGNGKLFFSLSRQPFANQSRDTIMQPRSVVFDRDAKATICFADSFGTKILVKYNDLLPAIDTANAMIRFLNLSAPVTSAELSTSDGAANFAGVAFAGESPFQAVAPGLRTFEVRDGNGSLVTTLDVDVNPSLVYTFYLSGSSNKQLRFFLH